MGQQPRKRVRLRGVVVQPLLVVDDGETLTDLPIEPVTVSPQAWPDYATTTFAEAVAAYEAKLNEQPDA